VNLRLTLSLLFLSGSVVSLATLDHVAAQDKEPVKKEETKTTEPKQADPFDQAKYDATLLQTANLTMEGGALLDYLKKRTVSDETRNKLLELVKLLGDDSYDVRQNATLDIQKYGISAVGILRQAERNSDYEISRRSARCLKEIEKVPSSSLTSAVARTLGRLKPEGATEALLNYLPFSDDELVTEDIRLALRDLAITKDKKADGTLVAALTDTLVLRRGAAAEALVRAKAKDVEPQLKKFVQDEKDLPTRMRVIVAFITGMKDKSFVPEMIRLTSEVPPESVWLAEDILLRLAGEQGPKTSFYGDQEARKKATAVWKEWWDTNEKKIDLAKLDEAEPFYGLTLVCEMDINFQFGRVVELNRDRKVTWKIEKLQYPIDARPHPGNKVLIAEHNANQIALWDPATGKKEWSENMNQPLHIERLRNGNYFAAGRHQIIEWDPNRTKKIFSIERPQYDICAVTKLVDGNILMLTNQSQLIKLNQKGEQLKTYQISPNRGYINFGSIQVLPRNVVLVTAWDKVLEFDLETGKGNGWEAIVRQSFSAQRLPNGNTLVSEMNRMSAYEFSREGKDKVWTYKPTENHRPLRAWSR
jgi:HEAT repeat protein